MPNKYQPITMRPLVGTFDCRSSVDESPPGAFRWKQCLSINPDGQLSRALGWLRFGSITCPSNTDFHDQGVSVADREPITLMFSSVENDGTRRLFIGTKTRLFVLDEAAGDYTPLTGGPFGADGSDSLTQTRFNAAELANRIVFTNNVDRPQIHVLGTTSVAAIPTLAATAEGDVSKAKRVIAWQGLMFLLNTVEAGVRHANRIRWSDFNDASYWLVSPANPTTGADSIADFQDLDPGEVILNAVPLGGSLYVFTDRSIWRCTPAIDVSVPSMTLSCVKVYTEPKNRDKCLAYPNSLVSTGFSAYYLGNDGVYEFNQYLAEPERVEWIHRATPVIFKNAETRIDKRACNSPVAEYVPGINEDATAGDGEIHFSWGRYSPDAILVAAADDCPPTPPIEGDGLNSYTLVVNTKFKTSDFRPYGSTALVNFTSDLNASGECNQQSLFLSADGSDWTIKKMNTGYAHEVYNPTTGLYSLAGYYSIARFVFPLERFDSEKEIQSFLVEATPVDPLETAVLRLRLGTSFEALDPNLGISVSGSESDALKAVAGSCRVLWNRMSDKPLKCSNTMTPEQYKAKNLVPNSTLEWMFLYRGAFLYAELTISNADGSTPTTGGTSLSRFEASVRMV